MVNLNQLIVKRFALLLTEDKLQFSNFIPTHTKQLTTKLTDYLPINFSDMRFIRGKRITAEIKKIIFKQADERLMVGMFRETSFQNGGQAWQTFFDGDFIEKLNKLSDVKCCDDLDENDGIGLMCDFSDKNNFGIIIGDFVQLGTIDFSGVIDKQMDIGDKLKPIEQRLPVLKKHLEQYDIYLKFKDKKTLSESEKSLLTAAHSYLKGVMLPVKAWKTEYAKLYTILRQEQWEQQPHKAQNMDL